MFLYEIEKIGAPVVGCSFYIDEKVRWDFRKLKKEKETWLIVWIKRK